jgi:hypothetical protein
MPKRATHTYESEKDGVKDSDLNVHYCMCCGESVLILGPGVVLASLPRRKTDGAYVLERGTTVFKLKSNAGENKLLKRVGGFERQYRLNCWNCNVPIAYRSEPPSDGSDTAAITYVLFDATGLQADLYLQLYQVPPCIQPTGDRSVRVAMEVTPSLPDLFAHAILPFAGSHRVSPSVSSPSVPHPLTSSSPSVLIPSPHRHPLPSPPIPSSLNCPSNRPAARYRWAS